MAAKAKYTFILYSCAFVLVQFIHGRSIRQESALELDSKVFQTGETTGYIQSNSTSTAIMTASGSPAGIINSGGTTTSFNGASTVNQDIPKNTSSSVGGSLSANCGGGQFGTFVAGQQSIGLTSLGNCSSYVESKK